MVKGCLCGVGFLLPFCESWGLNSGGWDCRVRVFTWGAILWTRKQISLEVISTVHLLLALMLGMKPSALPVAGKCSATNL